MKLFTFGKKEAKNDYVNFFGQKIIPLKERLKTAIPSKKTPGEELFKQKTTERLTIEADEPKTVRTLALICHNEVSHARGYGTLAKIGLIRSLLRQIDLPFLKIDYEDYDAEDVYEKAIRKRKDKAALAVALT